MNLKEMTERLERATNRELGLIPCKANHLIETVDGSPCGQCGAQR